LHERKIRRTPAIGFNAEKLFDQKEGCANKPFRKKKGKHLGRNLLENQKRTLHQEYRESKRGIGKGGGNKKGVSAMKADWHRGSSREKKTRRGRESVPKMNQMFLKKTKLENSSRVNES